MYRILDDPQATQEVQSSDTSATRLRELLWSSPQLMLLGAQNPAMPGHLLEELISRDVLFWFRGFVADEEFLREVHASVASNPNAPPSLLQLLHQRFPMEVTSNPVYALLSLESTGAEDNLQKQELIRQLSQEIELATKMGRAQVSPTLLQRAMAFPDEEVRLLVAAYSGVLLELLETLATDSSEMVRARVAGNPATPIASLQRLSADPCQIVRESVCENPKLPFELLLTLRAEFGALDRLAIHPESPEALLTELAENDRLLPLVLSNPNAPESILCACAEIPELQGLVARSPKTPIDVLLGLPKTIEVSRSLLQNAALPSEIVDSFLTHDEPQLRAAAAQHPNVPRQTLYWLWAAGASKTLAEITSDTRELTPQNFVRLYNRGVFCRCLIAAHQNAPESLLSLLSSDPSPVVRAALAKRAGLSVALSEVLSRDSAASVRVALAKSCAQESALQRLVSDYFVEVREALVQNPTLSQDLWRRLAADQARSVRLAMVSLASLSPGALEPLSQDADDMVRRLVVTHPNLSRDVLHKLARSPESHIQQLAQSRLTPQLAPRVRRSYVPIRREVLSVPTEDVWKIAREVLQKRIQSTKKK